MPNYIEDTKRITMTELSDDQIQAIALYITGRKKAGTVAKELGYNRQRFVNLVFTLLPQWYDEGRIKL